MIALVLLLAALALVTAGEWPKIRQRIGLEARESRRRASRKANLRLISGPRQPRAPRRVAPSETPDDFAASVQRDLENLPVIDPRDDRS